MLACGSIAPSSYNLLSLYVYLNLLKRTVVIKVRAYLNEIWANFRSLDNHICKDSIS